MQWYVTRIVKAVLGSSFLASLGEKSFRVSGLKKLDLCTSSWLCLKTLENLPHD